MKMITRMKTKKSCKLKKCLLTLGFTLTSLVIINAQAPDLVVTKIIIEPSENIWVDTTILFGATIKNIGDAATPSDVVHGVKFQIDGSTIGWNDVHKNSLEPGDSVDLFLTGSGN